VQPLQDRTGAVGGAVTATAPVTSQQKNGRFPLCRERNDHMVVNPVVGGRQQDRISHNADGQDGAPKRLPEAVALLDVRAFMGA
jgi:hypothetical protein